MTKESIYEEELNDKYLVHVTQIRRIPTLKIDKYGNYIYDVQGEADKTFYTYPLESILGNISPTNPELIDYSKLMKIAQNYYRNICSSYFNNGLYIYHDPAYGETPTICSTTCEATQEYIDKNLQRKEFYVMGGRNNGHVGLANLMIVIDTAEYDNPNDLLKQEKEKSILPSLYIKEAIIKDPYLGDIIIPNPKYYKNNIQDKDIIYKNIKRRIDYLFSNTILKNSIKMYNDLMKEIIDEINTLKIPTYYRKALLKYANEKTILINKTINKKTQKKI